MALEADDRRRRKEEEDVIGATNGDDNNNNNKKRILPRWLPLRKCRNPGGWKAMPFIFGNEICEKLAVMGIHANMISYLTQVIHMGPVKAATTLSNFAGTSSLTPLLGAFLADSYLGRFWVIAIGSCIYFMGIMLLTFEAMFPSLKPGTCSGSSCPSASSSQLAILYLSFLLMAIGSGGIRPCVVAFGADQLDERDPKQEKKRWSFFNWYYFIMGIASLTAVTAIVYIQDNVGWNWGFGIPAIGMAISITIFLLGVPLYRQVPLMGSPFTRLVRVIVVAFKKRNLKLPNDASSLHQHQFYQDACLEQLMHTDQFRCLDKAAIWSDKDVDEEGRLKPWRLCSVTEVEELKSIIRMWPIWAAGILLITASAQQGTFTILQAKRMDRHFGNSGFEIPAGSMPVFTTLSLLLTLVLYDRLFMGWARRLTGHPRGITFLQRMGIGFFLSTVATLVAGFVEAKRRHHAITAHDPLSVFWLLPQYCLHGVAEAFMAVGHLEFFYDQAPESLRSTATALFWTSLSAGSYLSSILVSIVHVTTHGHWLPKDLDHGHLDYFFWLLTLLQLLNLFFFMACARWYTYKPIHQQHRQGVLQQQGHGAGKTGVDSSSLVEAKEGKAFHNAIML